MQFPRGFTLLCLLLLWRLISVFVVQTAHVPDEYWQSLEVAHRMAFGYGHLTWEWTLMIRSYLYPFLISILYRILAALSLDSVYLLITLPRVFQAILVAYSDYRLYQWIGCKWALVVLCTNWYWYYCATRTLINSVETACTIIALSMYPWLGNVKNIKYLWIVGFLCMARPTAMIIWCVPCALHVYWLRKEQFLLKYVLICSSCFWISVLIDSYFYGKLVITLLRFYQVNVIEDVASAYGRENILWYVTTGIPVVLGLYCIPFAMNVWRVFRYSRVFRLEKFMFWIILIVLMIYSLQPHKEFRFILPLLPLFIYVGSASCCNLNMMTSRACWCFATLLLCSNLLAGIYFSSIHQRGTLDVMNYLRDEISHANASSTDTLILTPCHATPLYSHLHVDAPITFLTCEPNFTSHFDTRGNGRLVQSKFFEDPLDWLYYYFDHYHFKRHKLPTYVIAFDNVAKKITPFISRFNYRVIAKVFHTHFPQTNYGEYIFLFKQNPKSKIVH
ncbi:GPI mannosyltransferase [Ooceraea biroi]|uniref:Mannosyltransferase n=1 Tax=Ooceraea biroi TaxID=2015173 RepID=A0A026WMJ0_OOCBI|nr:GPI mannosyltransferase [Ooceraea biroi]